jgi:Tfp pilus assembly protein PilN
MNLELDFVRKSARISAPGAAMLACGLLAAGFSLQQYVMLTAEIDSRAHEGGARAVLREIGKEVDLDQLRARLLAANKIVAKRTTPWDALFRDIEAVSDKKVGLLSVQPELAGRQVRITGEAHDVAALTGYIERLAQKSSLGNLHLTGHEVRKVDGQSVIRFGLSATWTMEPA